MSENAKMLAERFFPDVEKPGRYTGGELNETVKDKEKVKASFAFCFPDTYEIGMSNLGIKILYSALNLDENIRCERCYAPWGDMGKILSENSIPLYALESGDAIRDFDFVGFTLQYELSYSNVLYMLTLAGIPHFSCDRGEDFPLVVAGGPCTYNPEPVADFFDLFIIGEGEEVLCELVKLYYTYRDECRENGKEYKKNEFLLRAAGLTGIYVPAFYDVGYADGRVVSVAPKYENIPERVSRAVVDDFETSHYPDSSPLPYIETVHDRIMLEAARGCMRGCRFCQAGMIYRPYRQRSPEKLNEQAKKMYASTGYDEISLTSLSISDHSELECVVDSLKNWTDEKMVSLSLPSMRVDSFSARIMEKIQGVRKSGLTFAPEAGTQRLRDIINKNLTEEEILSGCREAFAAGRTSVKLYFMLGLPFETDEDVIGIAELAQKIVDEYYKIPARQKGRSVEVTLSVSCFVPKCDTPFQYFPQDSLSELQRKQKLLLENIKSRSKKIRYNWHEARVSALEGAFARGDRRLARVLENASKLGIMFDGWDEYFDYEKWEECFAKENMRIGDFACASFPEDGILPWSHIDCGVTDTFLKKEAGKARDGVTTPACFEQCSHCGIAKYGKELCTKQR